MSRAIVVGAGPAGLMAAEQLADRGLAVDVYEQMPTAGRKLLRAGIGGLNITHSEPQATFLTRYSRGGDWLASQLTRFGAAELMQFFHELGIETFVGSSGRVFPIEKKAAPFLRRWLARLREKGVRFHFRHQLTSLQATQAVFQHQDSEITQPFDVCVLALGGGSWPELGSDGRWLNTLAAVNVPVTDFLPSNMGFTLRASCREAWSEPMQRLAGQPLKQVRWHWADRVSPLGECVITEQGVEGGVVYACASYWRDAILAATDQSLTVSLDVLPYFSHEQVVKKLSAPRAKQSLSKFLRAQLKLDPVKLALLYECVPNVQALSVQDLALQLKALSLQITGFGNTARAISTAGGVPLEACDAAGRLHVANRVFCAGEMLDWDAPTGGYLLTACFASGFAAGQAAAAVLRATNETH